MGIFLSRYKRFFVDFSLDSQRYTAHCPNTGSMETCFDENNPIILSIAQNPQRKLLYTLELVFHNQNWIFVNTYRVNFLMEWAFKHQKELLSKFSFPIYQYQYLKREPKFEGHKFDFLLFNQNHQEKLKITNYQILSQQPQNHSKPILIEIKNTTYYHKQSNTLQFPDAPTQRGTEQVKKLIYFLDQGFDCYVVFLLSRQEGTLFTPAYSIDPKFSHALELFHQRGGKILPIRIGIDVQEISKQEFTQRTNTTSSIIPNKNLKHYQVRLYLRDFLSFSFLKKT
ncbi:MAG: DNA/RNA nuclease SfsA [Leptospiraceae bacterium]|nr:DNA/RNA nuclease SfsA [Leptospiraceae bacterium]MDW7976961.1 DNA/RNA nuclease SfsA [Leptospiraceae bacterium]